MKIAFMYFFGFESSNSTESCIDNHKNILKGLFCYITYILMASAITAIF